MAVEEPSVVAAFSHAAKLTQAGGGVFAEADPPLMIGQLQLCPTSLNEARSTIAALEKGRAEIEAVARSASARMEARGGGFRRMEIREVSDPDGPPMVIVHLVVDVRDAMGANAINSICEAVAPQLERCCGAPVLLRILSNLAVHRLARAHTNLPVEALGGLAVAERIAEADRFARLDPFRAATHNKGLFNGIDAVVLATGNDWRAVEAGAHAYAARDGQYRGLTKWRVNGDHLEGSIELPMAVGTVGGMTKSHPTIRLLREILGAPDASTLAQICASVGLTQNLAALKALASEGIQRGHMSLHARQLALSEGAAPSEVRAVVDAVLQAGEVSPDRIRSALTALREGDDSP